MPLVLESAHEGTVHFGVFEVDLSGGELRKGGLKIKLQQQPFQILAALLEHPGEVVTREELRHKLWPDNTFVDFDSSLKTAINKVREALGDSANNPRFVETVTRRGYRFIAPVTESTKEGSSPAKPRKLRITLAVLPFDEVNGAPERVDFSDGMTQEMTTEMGRLRPERLGIIARTSALKYKHTAKGIDEIGRELGVDYILEGSVCCADHRVRINAQLIQVSDQTHLWADTYERLCQDVLAIQKQVARRIARSLVGALLPEPVPAA
ncbi:MAG: hypothetical protein DMG24_13830 [Acidobacteria bacterium]|nr:MAG: hypothetical protein DMG24_13830 [Acidobacteriota bacterium]